MSLQYSLFSLLYGVATVLLLAALRQAWQFRNEPGGRPLVVTLLGVSFWACCEFAITLVPGTELAIVFAKLLYVGVSVVVAGLVAFTLAFAGYERYLTRRTVAALAVWPLLFNLIIWLRPGLVYSSFTLDPSTVWGWEPTYGIAFGLNAVYSYFLLTVATFLLVRFTLTSKFLYQKQIAVLLVGIFTPWLLDLLYITRTSSTDLTVLGFAVAGISFTWATGKTKFLDVTPVARNTVVETLSSAVYVVDTGNRLVDSNQRGLELLDLSPEDVGRPVDELLTAHPEVAAEFELIAGQTEPTTTEMQVEDRYYETSITPLYGDRDDLVGRVFLVRDITEQNRQQERLKRQNERLEQFSSVVSHDLRSPLSVASGYVGLARQTGDPAHFDEIERSHRRMETLIDELLAFAKIDDEGLETEAVDLESCVKAAWGQVETGEFELDVEATTGIDANREYLLQLLENLFRNSVEHGEASGTVTVRLNTAATRDESPRLVVSDDGPGIPPDERESVLEQGYTTGDGVGLGLAIVSQVAAAHDWAVSVSESDTGGAAFVFDGIETVST